MIKEAIIKIVGKSDLTFEEARESMKEIMRGETTPTQNAAFLAALSTKNARAETVAEIAGCATAMREAAKPVEVGADLAERIVDIVGTGGDGVGTFNVSTVSAFVAAGAGLKVAKHGNRAASSRCGSADCLEALGANVRRPAERCVEDLRSNGFCFFFAPEFHPATRFVAGIRRELGFRTVFNVLGPLTNPARPKTFVLGVYDEGLTEPLARVLVDLGVRRGMTVFGRDGSDEISASAPTAVCEFKDGWFRSYVVEPEELGVERCDPAALIGGTPAENAAIARAILNGERGPRRNAVLLSAGAAIYLGGLAATWRSGVEAAAESIDSGAAFAKARRYVEAFPLDGVEEEI